MNLFFLDTLKAPSEAGVLARREEVAVAEVKRQAKKSPHSGGGVRYFICGFIVGVRWSGYKLIHEVFCR